MSAANRRPEGTDSAVENVLSNVARDAVGLSDQIDALAKSQAKSVANIEKQLDRTSRDLSNQLGKSIAGNEFQAIELIGKSTKALSAMESKLQDLSAMVNALRDFSMDQQIEVRRLRDGYDFTLIRNFAMRIIHALDDASKRIDRIRSRGGSEQTIEDLEFTRKSFLYAMEGSGIEEFSPPIGSKLDPSDDAGIECVAKQEVLDESKHMTVAEVFEPGYRMFLNESESRIVRPARISYYSFSKPTN